jgi:hypothetical protein
MHPTRPPNREPCFPGRKKILEREMPRYALPVPRCLLLDLKLYITAMINLIGGKSCRAFWAHAVTHVLVVQNQVFSRILEELTIHIIHLQKVSWLKCFCHASNCTYQPHVYIVVLTRLVSTCEIILAQLVCFLHVMFIYTSNSSWYNTICHVWSLTV